MGFRIISSYMYNSLLSLAGLMAILGFVLPACLLADDTNVSNVRPVAAAIDLMQQKYGWRITYEDPPFVGDATTVSSSVSEAHNAQEGVQQLLERDTKNRGFVGFRAVSDGPFINIVPTAFRAASGALENVRPILDSEVSMPPVDGTMLDWLSVFCQALSDASGENVQLGTVPTNLLSQDRNLVSGQQKARNLLDRELAGVPVSWQVWYAPKSRRYSLNVIFIDTK